MNPDRDRVPRNQANDYTEAEAARRRAFAHDHTGVELRDVAVYSVEPQTVAGNIDAIKEGIGKLVERIIGKPSGEPSRFETFSSKATETIKAHPIAAVAFALGLGYLVVRMVRR